MSNICFIIYDYTQKGGAERATSKLGYELSKIHNISIISLFNSNKKDAYKRIEGVKYYRAIDSKGSITKNIIDITKKIRKIIKVEGIDIVIAIDMATAFMAVLGTCFTNTKLIVCDRSSCFNETMYRHLALRIYAWFGVWFSDVLQVMTEEGKKGWLQKYHLKNDKIVVIPNWIDEKAIKNYPYNFDQHRIITVGRATPEKNYEELINIAENVKSQVNGWEWHIWGDFNSDYGKGLLEEIKKRRIDDFLIHKGTTNNLYEEYHKYSFLVLTSKFEGMPNVLLEAQGSKLPMIAYNCKTGPSELIEEGLNGYLVELNDTEAMIKKITDVITNKKLAERISEQSHITYERFSKETILKKWDKLLGGINNE